jgi:hypothetical protein
LGWSGSHLEIQYGGHVTSLLKTLCSHWNFACKLKLETFGENCSMVSPKSTSVPNLVLSSQFARFDTFATPFLAYQAT